MESRNFYTSWYRFRSCLVPRSRGPEIYQCRTKRNQFQARNYCILAVLNIEAKHSFKRIITQKKNTWIFVASFYFWARDLIKVFFAIKGLLGFRWIKNLHWTSQGWCNQVVKDFLNDSCDKLELPHWVFTVRLLKPNKEIPMKKLNSENILSIDSPSIMGQYVWFVYGVFDPHRPTICVFP